jgi:hypothetical protein
MSAAIALKKYMLYKISFEGKLKNQIIVTF